jgi:hypothetical protein
MFNYRQALATVCKPVIELDQERIPAVRPWIDRHHRKRMAPVSVDDGVGVGRRLADAPVKPASLS